MRRDAFRKQLKHTCTIERATAGAVDDLGQPTRDWDDLATGVACLFMPRSHKLVPGQELQDRFKDVLLTDFVLFMAVRDVTAQDRISNIRRADGSVIEAGPLNIRLVANAAGQDHHLEIHLEAGANATVP